MNYFIKIKNKLFTLFLSSKLKSCGKSYFFSSVTVLNPLRIDVGNNCLFHKDVWLAAQENDTSKGCIFIDDSVVISKGVIISAAYKISLCRGVTVGPYTMIMDNNHGFKEVNRSVMEQGLFGGEIKVGEFSWIGGHVTVLPGVIIGKGVIVGAGSVVTKSIEDYKIVVGNPARVIGDRRDKKYA